MQDAYVSPNNPVNLAIFTFQRYTRHGFIRKLQQYALIYHTEGRGGMLLFWKTYMDVPTRPQELEFLYTYASSLVLYPNTHHQYTTINRKVPIFPKLGVFHNNLLKYTQFMGKLQKSEA